MSVLAAWYCLSRISTARNTNPNAEGLDRTVMRCHQMTERRRQTEMLDVHLPTPVSDEVLS